MHMKKKLAVIFASVFILMLFTASGRAENFSPGGHSTGYMPSPVDRSQIESEPPILYRPGEKIPIKDDPLPAYYDMRQHGRVPDVRIQSPYGTCWAHAAIGSIETAYMTLFSAKNI